MRLLLIVSGSVALKKSFDLLNKLKINKRNIDCIVTRSGLSLIKSMKIEDFKNIKIYTDDMQLKDNNRMLHIELSRKADVVLVYPASANIIGKLSNGIADDLASTTLLASNKQIFICPAMNVEMWQHFSNQKNIAKLKKNGVNFIGPIYGNLMCGETGLGRIADSDLIADEINIFFSRKRLLSGMTGIVTAGPTIEPIDPVRYLSNYSSGRQGYSIAKVLAYMGANVKLISGPSNLMPPTNVDTINVLTAKEMNEAVFDHLPSDLAICAAAVSDFRFKNFSLEKIKKNNDKSFSLDTNPDILYNIGNSAQKRPKLVIGFAAETNRIKYFAKNKLSEKKCDWLLANKISKTDSVFGSEYNSIHFFTKKLYEKWPKMSKILIAKKLNNKILDFFE